MSFARYATIVTGTVALTSFGVFALRGAGPVLGAALLGSGLAALNALVAYALLLWAEGRSHLAFLRAVLGGMLGRMAVLLAAVVWAIQGLGVSRIPLVVSLLFHFVAFLGLELLAAERRMPAGAAR